MFDDDDRHRMYLTKEERKQRGLDKVKPVVAHSPVQDIENKTPDALKKHFIERASPLIDKMIDSALGVDTMSSNNIFAQGEVWEVLKDVIKSAENPAPLIDLRGNSIEDQIDKILQKVSSGDINFTEAKEYMSLVSQGYNLQKLPQLLAKLNELEDLS